MNAEMSLVQSSTMLRSARRSNPAARVATRSLDLVVAFLVLLVLSPVLLIIAIVVRRDSAGPAIFRQKRVGKNLKEFELYKFRTMTTGANAEPHRAYVTSLLASEPQKSPEDGGLYKLSVDDRITRVGRFLRSWSLDELPQLVNVLRGQMSLVGPRPVIPYEVEQYPESYLPRFTVRPGLTGLWQVSGRNERTYQEMVSADIEYAEHRTLWLDLKILVKTIPVVLGRRGVA